MKKNIILALALSLPLAGFAQGNNTRMGGNDGDYESLAHRVFNLEKKTDAFNVYFNYASSFQEYDDGNAWTSSFKNKQARIEIKGNITDKLSYRFRHRLEQEQHGAERRQLRQGNGHPHGRIPVHPEARRAGG